MVLSILVLAGLCSITAAEKLDFVGNEKGTHNLAFSGGGFAEIEGANALFSNPAGLEIQSGSHLVLALTDFSQSLYPLVHYGQRVSQVTCYALGMFSHRSRTEHVLQQGMLAGFTLSAMPRLILGGVVYSQSVSKGDMDGFRVDINLGSIYQWERVLWAALALKNLNRSRFGNGDVEYLPERNVAASLKIFPEKIINFYLDYVISDFSFDRAAYIISSRALLGGDRNLGITNSLRWDTRENAGISIGGGIALNHRIKKNLISLEYCVSGIPLDEFGSGILQAVSFNFYLSYFSDRFPPLISVKEERGYLSLASPKKPNNVFFRLFAEDRESNIKKWHLVICDIDKKGKADKLIRSFSGKGLPPAIIKWDGRDSFKNLLAPGLYTYRFIVADAAGNGSKTKWQMIEVKD